MFMDGRADWIALVDEGLTVAEIAERTGMTERNVRRWLRELGLRAATKPRKFCGYDRFAGALEFHHVDPSQKRFSLSQSGVARSLASAREEAAKCVLVCGNCHAEIEAGLVSMP